MTVPNVTDAPAAPSQVLRVAIVDDDPFVLQALRAYLSSDERIEVIVERTGFSEPSTFYRAFKRWVGETPVEFRRRGRPQPPVE